MSDFYTNAKKVADNVSYTENGMAAYKTTSHALADFNFNISSFRGDLNSAKMSFKKILDEKETYALKYLFYLRDAREGLGERDLFRTCVKELLCSNIKNKDEIVSLVIKETPEYGRYDDLLLFLDTKYDKLVVSVIKEQLKKDFENYRASKPISLLAKWMPSANASNKDTIRLANKLIKSLGTTPKEYRKTLSALRAHLNVIETMTCDNRWGDIDYNAVPSKANLKYKNAFLKNDEARRREFLAKVNAGDKTVKVNMGVSFPHEIVAKYHLAYRLSSYDDSLEAYWKALKAPVALKDTIVVRDGSGSMSDHIKDNKGRATSVSALDVSTALAVYCSQYTKAAFKDKFITFSSQARIVDLSKCGSLRSKLAECYSNSDCSNTNLENVFALILNTAVNSHMSFDEMPSNILIISDMQFDGSTSSGWGWGYGGFNLNSNVIEKAKRNFEAYGYKLPQVCFWNVDPNHYGDWTIPCTYNENGVKLISGFSQNALSIVMNGEKDPYEALIKELNKERYENIPLIMYTNTDAPKTVYKKTSRKVKSTPTFLK